MGHWFWIYCPYKCGPCHNDGMGLRFRQNVWSAQRRLPHTSPSQHLYELEMRLNNSGDDAEERTVNASLAEDSENPNRANIPQKANVKFITQHEDIWRKACLTAKQWLHYQRLLLPPWKQCLLTESSLVGQNGTKYLLLALFPSGIRKVGYTYSYHTHTHTHTHIDI